MRAGADSSCSESGAFVIDTAEECLVAAAELGITRRTLEGTHDNSERPAGCFVYTHGNGLTSGWLLEFNLNLGSPDAGRWSDTYPICRRHGKPPSHLQLVFLHAPQCEPWELPGYNEW